MKQAAAAYYLQATSRKKHHHVVKEIVMSQSRVYYLLIAVVGLGVLIGVAVSKSDIIGSRSQEGIMQSHLRQLAQDAFTYRTQFVKRDAGGVPVRRDLYIGYRIPAELSSDEIAMYSIVGHPTAERITFIATLRKDPLQKHACHIDEEGTISFQ